LRKAAVFIDITNIYDIYDEWGGEGMTLNGLIEDI